MDFLKSATFDASITWSDHRISAKNNINSKHPVINAIVTGI